MSTDESRKLYKNVVQYVKREVMSGALLPGDKLPTERVLAERLAISRNSVREGLRVLENIGIIQSTQGSGNYISVNFDDSMAEVLSFMYFIKGLDEVQVTEFRWMIEREAIPLAVERITEEERSQLREILWNLDQASEEEQRILYDQQLHSLIIRSSQNGFLIANYEALIGFMDRYIGTMRQRIIRGMESSHELEKAHHLLAEGVLEGNTEKSIQGLEKHFGYIAKYKNL